MSGSAKVAALILLSSVSQRAVATTARTPGLPFTFVENRGQTAQSVHYIAAGPEFKGWFCKTEVVLQRGATTAAFAFDRGGEGAEVRIEPDQPLSGKANYFLGSQSADWHRNLPLYGRIRYRGLWPGIELIYKEEHGRLKAEYTVNPAADVGRILLRFQGGTQIQADGSLVISGITGAFSEEKPLLYQEQHGQRKEIPGGFEKFSNGSIGFWVGEYDHNQPLVIDPAILISGYFGGSSEDNITAVTIDALGNIIVAGWTSSTNLPTSAGYQKRYGGSVDAFVASFEPNGGGLNYCTYLGGSGEDQALALAVDGSRNVFITGWTASVNFPVVGAIQKKLAGTRDAFVVKLNSSGSALLYSTYLGGSGADTGYAIALTPATAAAYPADSAVIVGDTNSTNFPVTNGVFQPQPGGSQDAFVAMVSPAGNVISFATYLGGSGTDHAASVAVAPGGSIFVGGYTWSSNFPVLNAAQPCSGGGQDGFLVKLKLSATGLAWSTYVGGSGGSIGFPEEVNAIAIDHLSNIVVAGTTSSNDFPVTPGAFQTTFGGETDAFLTRYSNAGALLESTYLGGTLAESITAVTTDFHGYVYAAGSTFSPDFPVQWPFQATNAGMMDAFVAKLNTTLSTLMFSTYLGGNGSDQANAIAVDAETSIIVAGQTGSANYPVSGSLNNYLPSVLTSFITKIRPNFTLGVAYPNASQLEFTADPWHVMSDTASTFYGLSTDIPIVGDWSGTGVKRIGIFRNGTWFLDTNGDGIIDAADQTVVFGQAGDIPVVGDWRGTGHIALGLYRKGSFILDYSGHLSGVPTGLNDVTISNFGLSTDIPIVNDWSGSGTAKVGVFRNGSWLVDYNGAGVISQTYIYGQAGDIPVVGDWDSSGNPPKIGIYRSGLWVLDYDGDHVWTTPGLTEMSLAFGFAGYTPLIF